MPGNGRAGVARRRKSIWQHALVLKLQLLHISSLAKQAGRTVAQVPNASVTAAFAHLFPLQQPPEAAQPAFSTAMHCTEGEGWTNLRHTHDATILARPVGRTIPLRPNIIPPFGSCRWRPSARRAGICCRCSSLLLQRSPRSPPRCTAKGRTGGRHHSVTPCTRELLRSSRTCKPPSHAARPLTV